MILKIRRSKTDQTKKGCEVVVAKTGDLTCPCIALMNYMFRANIPLSSDHLIFRNICKSNNIQKLLDQPLKYSRTRALFAMILSSNGLDAKAYGTHSLRSGRATTAINKGISFDNVKRHGRWRSEKSAELYIAPSLQTKLSVSKCFGSST